MQKIFINYFDSNKYSMQLFLQINEISSNNGTNDSN